MSARTSEGVAVARCQFTAVLEHPPGDTVIARDEYGGRYTNETTVAEIVAALGVW